MKRRIRTTATRSRLRRVLGVVAGAGLLVATLVVLASSSFIQNRLLAFIMSSIEQRYGIVSRAENVSIDLTDLDVHVRGLTLAATGRSSEPFFHADEVHIDLPWSVAWRTFSAEVVSILGPRLLVRVAEDGSSNLPTVDDPPTPRSSSAPSPLPVANLLVHDLSVDWQDLSRRLVVEIGPTSLDLVGDPAQQLAGAVDLAGNIVVDVGDQAFVVTALDGRLWFDGSTLGLDELRAQTEEATLTATGRIDSLLSDPSLDMTLASTLDMPALGSRLGDEALEGELTITGSLTGSIRDPEARLSVEGDRVSWRHLTMVAIDGALNLTSEAIHVQTLSTNVAGGQVHISGRGALTESEPNEIEAAWNRIGADTLLPPLLLDGRGRLDTDMTGTLTAQWTAFDPRSIIVTGQNRTTRGDRVGESTLVGEHGRYRLALDQPLGRTARVHGTIDGVAVSARWSQTELDGRLTLECSRLGTCATDVGALSLGNQLEAADGTVQASLQIAGSVGAPSGNAFVQGQASLVDRMLPLDLALEASGDLGGLEVSAARLSIGESTVSGFGTVAWESGQIHGRLAGDIPSALDLAPLVPDGWTIPSGHARFESNLAGTLTTPMVEVELEAETDFDAIPIGAREPLPLHGQATIEMSGSVLPVAQLSGTVRARDLTWNDTRVGSATATADYRPDRLAVDFTMAEFGTTGMISVELTDDLAFATEVHVASVDRAGEPVLTAVGQALELPLSGDLTLDIEARGWVPRLSETTITVGLGLERGRVGSEPLTLSPPRLTATYDASGLFVDEVELRLGSSRLSLSGGLRPDRSSSVTVQAGGELGTLVLPIVGALDSQSEWPTIDLRGRFDLDGTVAGWIDDPVVTGQLAVRDGHIVVGDRPPVDLVDVQLSYADRTARIVTLGAVWQDASLDGHGSLGFPGVGAVGAGPLRLHLRAESITERALAGVLDEETLGNIDGLVTAVIDLQAEELTLLALRGEMIVEEATLSVSGIPLAQRQPTRLNVANGRVSIDAFDWGNDADYLTIGGAVALSDDPMADLELEASLDLGSLSAFSHGAAVEGRADLAVDIRGSVSDLDVNGKVELTDAGFRVAEPRLVGTGITGTLLLAGDRMTPQELRGELNGGSIEIGGELRRLGPRPTGRLTLEARQLAMNVPEGLRTEVDADLALAFEDAQTTITGSTVIQRGDYREPMSLTGGLLSAVDDRRQVRVVGLDEPGPLDDVRLDVRVTAAQDIVLDNNYLSAALTGDVRLTGTVGTPALAGRVALLEGGRMWVGTRVYDIERGTIDLVDPTGIEPRVDVRARTRADRYDITLAITGGRGNLQTMLESDPPLSEPDIVSVLLTGQTLSDAASDPDLARNQALGLLSSEMLGAAGRQIGLDVRIGQDAVSNGQIQFDSSLVAGERDPSSQLTVGARLSDRIQLILSQDLRGSSGPLWIVSYLAQPNVEIRGLFLDERDRAYEVRHALDFGVPPRPDVTGAARRSSPNVRVSGIRFTGAPGVPVSTLQDRTRLRVGDAFDFYRWQEDQDRLRRVYADEGRWEARVSARRQESTGGGVTLDYDIEAGPPTRLVIEGTDLPRSVVQELERAWELSVFDSFLLDELRSIVEAYLRREGYLRGTVQTEVAAATAPGAKTIVIRVSPGPHTDERTLQFVGNSTIDTPTLQAVSDTVLDGDGDWGDVDLLERTLLRLYRREGFLDATVRIGGIEFDGTRANLPVQITEGRRFTIAAIDVSGADARSESEARDTLALSEGDNYSDRAVADALNRLEQDYHRRGFNEARVSAESTVDLDEGSVRLALTIQEGPQEMLDEIVVQGADHTNAGLITSALAMDLGEPVDLTAWNLARLRLYETGVFRSVDVRAEPTDAVPAPTGVRPTRARVILEEWPTYSLRYGLRVNDLEAGDTANRRRDFGLGFAADASRRNLLGRGATVGASIRAGDRGRAVRGYFRLPQSFGLPIRSSVYVERSRITQGEDAGEFPERLTTVAVEQRTLLPSEARLTYSVTLDRHEPLDAPSPAIPGSSDAVFTVLKVAGNVVLDRRDSLFNATQGWFHSSHVDYGFQPSKSESTFVKYLAQQYHHWSLGRVVLASAGRLGLATGLGNPLIASERFFAGGANTVRGYAQDSLGPTTVTGVASGGNALVIVNGEIRMPVVWRFGMVGFVDAGNVFETVRDTSIGDLAVGTGLGLRLQTPIGLFRFDYGFALTRDADTPSGRWHFSIGQAF